MNAVNVADHPFLAELVAAKQALEAGLYTPEDFAIVSRACANAQSLSIGIKSGVLRSDAEIQAAFFAALGLSGKPSEMGCARGVPVRGQSSVVVPTEPNHATTNARSRVHPRFQRPRHRSVAHCPPDVLERDHRP